jgi:hypothetical protein
MQCPLSGGCFMSPKFVFLGIACLGLGLGALSAFWPRRSIGLYQWIMERFNWKVVPIDEPREVGNTRILGIALVALSAAILLTVFSRF